MFRFCRIRRLWGGLICCALWAPAFSLLDSRSDAGELLLKNGTQLSGTIEKLETIIVGPKKPKDENAIQVYPLYSVKTNLKRYVVPRTQEEILKPDASLNKFEGFAIEQRKQANGSRIISAVQGYASEPEPFDEFGRRRVFLTLANGEATVLQGITKITPDFVEVIALDFSWKTAIATSSIPFKQLERVIRKSTRQNSPQDRLKIATFFIQSQFYDEAENELKQIGLDFPELGDTVTAASKQLHVAKAIEYVRQMKLRREAGQHSFVYQLCKKFPVENVEANTLRQVRDLETEYDDAIEKVERVKNELASLQAELKADPRVKELAPIRGEISEKLNFSNLGRLDAYFKLSGDPKLNPDEKLALALSGWVVGNANAVTELDQALRFWQARQILSEYLNGEIETNKERKELLTRLEALEGVGAERVAQMIPLVPYTTDVSERQPGQAVRMSFPIPGAAEESAYWVTLPIEYHPDHSYPVIVALHDERGTPLQELQGFWGGTEQRLGQAQRHGYILIGPEYVPAGKGYDFSEASHRVVVDSIRDALRRFSIDANKVFLAGHGMGGDAAWDIGLAHPYLFAGVIPINGAIDRYAPYYLENGKGLSFYAVNGEKDLDLYERNKFNVMKIMKAGTDMILTEYQGAGPESFISEIHALYEWMGRIQRDPIPKQLDIRTLREYDSFFSWFEFSGLPENNLGIDWNNRQRAVHPLKISATINPGNTIVVTSNAARHRIWIPRGEGLVDFNKRLAVRIKGKQVYNDFVKPDLEVMLERVRTTGDRQQLFWGVLEFPVGR